MDFHIKLEHHILHKIRLIFKVILIMYPCVAFVVALLVAAVAAAVAATVAILSVPPVAEGALHAVAAVAVGASVAAGV